MVRSRFIGSQILKSKMSKFLTKLNEENEYKKPYSPTNEINDMEIEEYVPSNEPSSPVSITFEVAFSR